MRRIGDSSAIFGAEGSEPPLPGLRCYQKSSTYHVRIFKSLSPSKPIFGRQNYFSPIYQALILTTSLFGAINSLTRLRGNVLVVVFRWISLLIPASYAENVQGAVGRFSSSLAVIESFDNRKRSSARTFLLWTFPQKTQRKGNGGRRSVSESGLVCGRKSRPANS